MTYNECMPDEVVIEARSLSKSYGDKEKKAVAIDSVSLSVEKNSKVAVMGPSGSGKSTLLHMIGGLDKPTSGSVIVNGNDIRNLNDFQLAAYRNRSVGFIFQAFNLQPHLCALENVALPLILSGMRESQANEYAASTLKRVNLYELIDKFPSQLSGGEMQRVAIARAIIKRPLIILADEPTANLDKDNAKNVLETLLNLELEQQALITVTHDETIAARFDRIVKLEHGHIVSDENLYGHVKNMEKI